VAALLSFTGVGVVVAAAASAAIVNGLSGGNLGTMLRAGAIAGATAFAFNVVGSATNAVAGYDPSGPHITPQFGTPEYAFNVAGHAGVGCLTSVASGGSCQNGALSAAAGAAATPLVPGNLIGGTAVSSVVGGLASVAGGGKFENGAVTAAFGYLFNNCYSCLQNQLARQDLPLLDAPSPFDFLGGGIFGGIRAFFARSALEEAAAVGRTAIRLGEYAGESIAARSAARDFTAAERAEINRIGSETGCHTCGTTNPGTKSGNFIPDHQPPSSLNLDGLPQRLYPHCLQCSRIQGGQVRGVQ
jgi:hypothetical protein